MTRSGPPSPRGEGGPCRAPNGRAEKVRNAVARSNGTKVQVRQVAVVFEVEGDRDEAKEIIDTLLAGGGMPASVFGRETTTDTVRVLSVVIGRTKSKRGTALATTRIAKR